MVKIFTLEELLNQKIPKREDYRIAIDSLRKEYQTLFEEGSIYGALFYGSLFKNGGNGFLIGSDIDQIIVTNGTDNQTLDTIRHLREKVNQMHIPAEFHIFELEMIREGYHGYEKTFLEDLKMHVTPTGVIGTNVLDLIKPNCANDYEILRDRQVKNLRRLSRDVSAPRYSKTHCTFLGRIINYSIYLAKDMIHLKSGEHATFDGELLPKELILTRYESEFPQIDANPLRKVLELRAKYALFLDGKNPYDTEMYKKILDQIDNCYKGFQEFFRVNLKIAESLNH